MLRLVIVAVLITSLAGCASAPRQMSSSPGRVLRTDVSAVPFEQRFQMTEGDAREFRLPGGKTVAVWCERPSALMFLAEQTTASGLKTAWGERAFKQPEPIKKQISPNSYELAVWQSYISQGSVITSTRSGTSEYVLFVDDLQFSIIEDLKTADSLPVTIRITKK